ncbi:HIT domain-containing protein [Phanerochaete sordida]|uniref:HIT domain-containing protein n=1 Tax=Phanerochaete sordida TaxID=48140 RepID=A0A9P3G1B3_9APHY|nr:HIT domain-containing protein [Phanerochaete sordida]
MSSLFFSTIEVTRQAFYRTPLTCAIVNLKPIVPGHVLVIPKRVVPRLKDLDAHELAALMASVQAVGTVIERVYGADALTVACQDGRAAGQTVPHVHFHLLPRKMHGDRFAGRNDAVYPALERSENELPQELASIATGSPAASPSEEKSAAVESVEPLHMDADEDRRPRSMEEMIREAEWLKGFFTHAEQL